MCAVKVKWRADAPERYPQETDGQTMNGLRKMEM